MSPNAAATAAAPIERLWTVVSDVTAWPRHLDTFDEIVAAAGNGSGGEVGRRFRVRQPGLPAATYEITEWSPPTTFTWVARSPGVVTTAAHILIPTDRGTELALSVEWRGPLAPLVRLLATRRTQRMIEIEATTLTRVAESDG